MDETIEGNGTYCALHFQQDGHLSKTRAPSMTWHHRGLVVQVHRPSSVSILGPKALLAMRE